MVLYKEPLNTTGKREGWCCHQGKFSKHQQLSSFDCHSIPIFQPFTFQTNLLKSSFYMHSLAVITPVFCVR